MVKAVKRRSVSSVRSSYNTRRLHTVYRHAVDAWVPAPCHGCAGALRTGGVLHFTRTDHRYNSELDRHCVEERCHVCILFTKCGCILYKL